MNFVPKCLNLLCKQSYRPSLHYIARRSYADRSSKLKKLLEGLPEEKVNQRDGRGWTALMLAAKEGEADAVELLLNKGAETELLTPSGYSAHDIAVFWQKEPCAKLLKPIFAPQPADNFFSYPGIHRNAIHRNNQEWIQETLIKETSEFILMYKAQPVVMYEDGLSPRAKVQAVPDLMFKPYESIHHLVSDSLDNLIYLGTWGRETQGRKPGEKSVDKDLFTIDVSETEEQTLAELYPGCEVMAATPSLLGMSESSAGIIGQAKSLLDWHLRYKFCPTCGSPTKIVSSGYRRDCTNSTCSTHKGTSNTRYPRVDPTVISAVISRDNENCLLGRQKGFPHGMYSCLAGFVEPGESVEQACRREVEEETGVLVTNVKYHSSQPWPMPSGLMLGCMAQVEYDLDLKVDTEELEDARWFTRQEVVLMLMHLHPEGISLPPRQAIAHRLINEWLVQSAFVQPDEEDVIGERRRRSRAMNPVQRPFTGPR